MPSPEVEHRLTELEDQVASLAIRSAHHGQDIGAIKDQMRADEAVRDAADTKWTKREKTIAAIATVVLPTCAILTILHI